MCPMKRFYEQGKIRRYWIDQYCKGDWTKCVRYQQEEKGIPHPDYMMPDGSFDESLK